MEAVTGPTGAMILAVGVEGWAVGANMTMGFGVPR